MGLYQYVYLCFDASSLPCLHTFWHAISTSCYIFSEYMSFIFQQPNQPNEVGVEVQLDHGENLQSSSSHEKVWPIFFFIFRTKKIQHRVMAACSGKKLLYNRKLSRDKILWLCSYSQKFSPRESYFPPMCKSFLPWKFPLCVSSWKYTSFKEMPSPLSNPEFLLQVLFPHKNAP